MQFIDDDGKEMTAEAWADEYLFRHDDPEEEETPGVRAMALEIIRERDTGDATQAPEVDLGCMVHDPMVA